MGRRPCPFTGARLSPSPRYPSPQRPETRPIGAQPGLKAMELAKTITDRGTEAGLTVCSAESCAGGLVTAALTDIAGIAVCTTGTAAPESPWAPSGSPSTPNAARAASASSSRATAWRYRSRPSRSRSTSSSRKSTPGPEHVPDKPLKALLKERAHAPRDSRPASLGTTLFVRTQTPIAFPVPWHRRLWVPWTGDRGPFLLRPCDWMALVGCAIRPHRLSWVEVTKLGIP